jgi:hypothetical protein
MFRSGSVRDVTGPVLYRNVFGSRVWVVNVHSYVLSGRASPSLSIRMS